MDKDFGGRGGGGGAAASGGGGYAVGTSLADYDSIQLTMPDIHTVPRGKVVTNDSPMLTEGWEMWRGITMLGPKGGNSSSEPYLAGSYSNHPMRPCLETLTPWPWVDSPGRRVGNVLCDMTLEDGSPDTRCPRQLLKAQLSTLNTRHGLSVSTAFEYHFYVFKEDTLEPVGGPGLQTFDLRVWGRHQEMFSELRDTLRAMGVKVRAFHPEDHAGMWELTTEPYPGVTGADVAFYVKNAVKGVLKTRGCDATFMASPTLGSVGCSLDLNHSLWKTSADGSRHNAFMGRDEGLSAAARHWMSGLLKHAEALNALLRPSLDCYGGKVDLAEASGICWGLDDRRALLRAKVQSDNVFLEHRGSKSSASPYLALAGVLAAGMDGLDRRLECPPPMDTRPLPATLAQALTALEQDRELTARLGEDFVRCYVSSKRDNEVLAWDTARLTSDQDRLAFQRDLYFHL